MAKQLVGRGKEGRRAGAYKCDGKNSKKDLSGPTHGAVHQDANRRSANRWHQASTLGCFTVSKSYNSSKPKQPCLALQPCSVSNTNVFQSIVSKLEMSNS